jgi:peptidoglycan pentaglycine glycine transferase (the first glycine)
MDLKYVCRISGDEENPSWDNFIAGIPGGHHEQTVPWAKVRSFDGWSSKRIILEQDGTIIAGAQILLRKMPFFGSIGYISYGPCVHGNSLEIAEKLLQEIVHFTKVEKIGYLTINLPYFADYFIPLLLASKFLPIVDGFPPPRLMTSTLLIDLSKDLDEILAEMKSKTRYNIRNSIRHGIIVREGSSTDIDLFFDLMIKTCTRRNSPPSHPNKKFFEILWENFYPRGWVKIHIAEYNQEPVCAILSFTFGDIFRIWKFGWSGNYNTFSPSNALYWNLIQIAKQEGFRHFDFVSLDTEVSKAIQQELPITPQLMARYFYGPTVFKMGFGGEVIHLPGHYCFFSNPFIRATYKVFRRIIFKNEWMKHALEVSLKRLKSNRGN